jgi:DNA replication protein DnaC
MNEYLKCDILFIDDLGTENKINNVTDEYFYSVINERMQNHRKTIITTNLDLGQIQDVYGERIFSRLMHKKQSLKINFVGSDLRIKK